MGDLNARDKVFFDDRDSNSYGRPVREGFEEQLQKGA
jgi:hypothetical protein